MIIDPPWRAPWSRPDTLGRVETDYQLLLSDAERTLDSVDAALGRLSDGTYGTCERCGEAIDDARLATTPTTLDCGRHDD